MAFDLGRYLKTRDIVPDHSFTRLKSVFGLPDAHLSVAIGVVGPIVFLLFSLLLTELGLGSTWTTASVIWMLLPIPMGSVGILIGVPARNGPNPLIALAGVVLNTVGLLAWSYLLFFLFQGA
jgi:hypothetical protein